MPSSQSVRQARQRVISDILRLQAHRNPCKTALVFEGQRDTFLDLDLAVNRAANALRALGLGAGTAVALFSHNNRAFVVLRFAIARVGAILVPINFMLGPAEVAYVLRHSQCHMILAEDALCGTADEALSELDGQIGIKAFLRHADVGVPEGWIDGDALLSHADAGPLSISMDEDDPVQIMYTSGTESRPKGVLLSSRSLFAQYASCIIDCDMQADDIELHCLPLFHCAQLDCFLTVDLYLGATSVLLRSPDAATMLKTIEVEGVTKLFCPPTVWISLLRHPDFDRCDLTSLRKGYYGASIMPTAIIEEILERLPGIRLWNMYGQTEMAPLATVLRPEFQLSKLGSAGKPALNVETRIVDDEDNEVAAGQVGEIVHRSAHAMLGYLHDEAKTSEVFRHGWLHSGDLGRMDDEGFLYVVDRKKDMIKSGGENVASREVEELLFRHPAVAEVAVVGLPDARWIEAVTAIVVARAGTAVTGEELGEFCRQHLAGYKRPKRFLFVTSLPRNASGKILKREIKAMLAEL